MKQQAPLTEADVRHIVREEIEAVRQAEDELRQRAAALFDKSIGEMSRPVATRVEGGVGGQGRASPHSPALILERLRETEADLAEAKTVHEFWLTEAESAGLVLRRGFRRVADGQGGFSEEPIPSSDQQSRT